MLTLKTLKPDKSGGIQVVDYAKGERADELAKPLSLLKKHSEYAHGIWDGDKLVAYHIPKGLKNSAAIQGVINQNASQVSPT
jgi:hypothetical protein